MYLLDKKYLDQLLAVWSDKFDIITPVKQDGDVMLLPYKALDCSLDYINFTMPVKEFLFEQQEELFTWKKEDQQIRTTLPDKTKIRSKVLFGIRPCDAYGIAYKDRFYIEEFRDINYEARRAGAYVVVMNCTKPGNNCFCKSTGIGPFAELGYDLALTPMENGYYDGFLVEVGSQKGEELVSMAASLLKPAPADAAINKEAILDRVKKEFELEVDLADISKIMEATYNSPVWKEISKACIACTGCTHVCPTCTCFNVVEEFSDNDEGCRMRCWDSCQNDSFTRNAGGHNPRNEISRVRYRIYDKLKYIEERFGFKGCTGCGRCIGVCPALVNIVEIANVLRKEYEGSPENITIAEAATAAEAARKFESGGHTHKDCEHIYIPQIAVIKAIIQETKDIKRFIVQYEDKALHENYKFFGQFFEITIFGVGEIAISIPFGPSQKDYFDFCVKKSGKVTTAMHNLKVGDKVGLRGPFGKGFPYEELKGKDILIIGSGVGLAPVRTMIVRILENRADFGKLAVIASATGYDGLVYKEDLIKWGQREDMSVHYALSAPTDKVEAHVGYINDLLPGLGLDWERTAAIICASPKRIKAVAKDLIKLGMKGTDILTSLETHMRCGIGKCGHCKVGNKYMCVDGPVFNYEEMLTLPPEF